jgi:hypothetical protein
LGVTARPTYPRTWHNRQRRLPRRYQLRSEEPSGQGEWTWPGLNGALSAGFETWLKGKGSYPSCEKRRGGLRGSAGIAKSALGDHVPARTELANILDEWEVF